MVKASFQHPINKTKFFEQDSYGYLIASPTEHLGMMISYGDCFRGDL